MGRIADKFLLFLYSVVVMLVAGIGILLSLTWIESSDAVAAIQEVYASRPVSVVVLVVCAVLFLLSLRFLFLSLRRSRERSGSIDQRTEFGDIRISLETVENLSLKAAGRIRGAKDVRARVRVDESGLDIQLRSVIDGESSIPHLTEEMQRAVKEHVEEITGIPVASVTVYVANVVQSQSFKARVE
ncbi:alkaline shock response membrane anchor protein AmaP [Paenibacillus sp. TRM 82003]|nr:alkaline shock response membrane anchor protein AmaP [Paenibacillus sp. TRM 82003]